jgi:hypothetical protein
MARYPYLDKHFALTTVAADTATAGFSVPEGVVAMTVFAPALTTDTTFNIQILDPRTAFGGTETWSTLNVYDLADGTNKALSDVPDTVAVMIMPIPNTCALRFSYTTAQAATWVVLFHY